VSKDLHILEVAIAAAHLGVHRYCITTGEINWDHRVRELWGVPENMPVDYAVFIEGVHPLDRETTQAAVNQALDSKGSGEYSAQFRVISRSTGEERWIKAFGRVRFENTAAVELIGTVEDITQQVAAVQALRASETRLRLAIETANLGVHEYDIINDQAWWSPELLELTGVNKDTEVNFDYVRDNLHPQDRMRVLERMAQSLLPEGSGEFAEEFRVLRHGTKEVRWFYNRAKTTFVQEEGRRIPQRSVGIVMDITARKEAEEKLLVIENRLRFLLQLSDCLYSLKNAEQIFFQAAELLGNYLHADRVIFAEQDFECPGILRITRHFSRDQTDLQGSYAYSDFATDLAKKVQDPALLQTLIIPAKLQGQSLVSLVIQFRDVIERDKHQLSLLDAVVERVCDAVERVKAADALRASEERLRAIAKQLKIVDQRKDEFLAMLAHELRSPLAPLRNASEVLALHHAKDSASIEPLKILQRQVVQMTRLVEDLLDVSRIAFGQIQLQLEMLEISAVINQAAETVSSLMLQKKHTFNIEVPRGEFFVRGDRARLVQALSNLLNNAAKYTEDHGKICLSVYALPELVEIVVTDNGSGIASEMIPHVFDLFTQSPRTLDRAQGGLGIGLSVVKRLIEAHGGSVSVLSGGPGSGSRFTVKLPRLMETLRRAEKKSVQKTPQRHIFVVDDNIDSADSLALLLKLDGHRAQALYSPEQALVAIAEQQPDIVLLDIGLPRMDGYEVAKKIRSDSTLKNVRLFALSGYSQVRDRERAFAVGFEVYLIKPADLDTLKDLIHRDREAALI
jgi:PAS domain S-box-containing protein